MPKTLPNHLLIKVAADARCNVPTVRRYVAGELKRRSTIDAINTALHSNGLDYVRTEQPRSLAIDSTPGSKA